ncbi:MAG: hypothetical protein ABIG44_12000 [Planctomycetota bacterium]
MSPSLLRIPPPLNMKDQIVVPHHRRILLLVTILLGFAGSAAQAQGPRGLSPQQRGYIERLARARARADLLQQVYTQPITDQVTLGQWAAREVPRDRALRLWIRSQPGYGTTRFYSDGSADVDTRLESTVLLEQLQRLRRAYPARESDALDPDMLRRIVQRWPVLWGAGTADWSEKSRSRKPAGWEDVTFEGLEVVRRAAEADARYALLARAAQLPVTNAHHLREFLDASDTVENAVLQAFERVAEVNISLELDQVAVGTARISMLELIRILTEVHQKHYQGDLFHVADFRGMALLSGVTEITATGLAIPPTSAILRTRYQTIELDAPTWITQRIQARGRFEPHDAHPLNEADQIEAARLDGIDRLRQQVEALIIKDNVTVEQFLGYHDELKDDVIIFLGSTRLAGPAKTTAGILEVPIELPLRRLWWILRRGMERIEVDLPAEPPTTRPSEEKAP